MASGTTQTGRRIGLIVLSRFDSRRLPGKALSLIGDRPLLGCVLDRVREVRNIDQVCVATSERVEDNPIAEFATEEGVTVFRGDLNNVAKRCLDCAVELNFDDFVRISGDSPFIDWESVTRLVDLHRKNDAHVTTNVAPRTFPQGTSVEVIEVKAMREAVVAMTELADQEHVTQYFYNHSERFQIFNVEAHCSGLSDVVLTVDTPEDLERANWITKHLPYPPSGASLEVVVEVARQWVK